VLNRAFLLIQDFEFSKYPEEAGWKLLTSKTLTPGEFEASIPPLRVSSNDFAGMSLEEINAFVRTNAAGLEEMDLSVSNWLVIDQKGLETSTCVVCEQYYNGGSDEEDGEGEAEMTDAFRAARLPYEQAHTMVVNLDIANMGFEDFVDEDAGEQEDGTWKWQSFPPQERDGDEGPNEVQVKREAALKELRDAGDVE
jgi:hypothetical protein